MAETATGPGGKWRALLPYSKDIDNNQPTGNTNNSKVLNQPPCMMRRKTNKQPTTLRQAHTPH